VGLGRVAVAIGVVVLAAGAAAPGDARRSAEPGPILYSTGGDEDDQCGTISSVEPDGAQPKPLDVGPGESCDPGWSPDGQRIAFRSNQGGPRLRIYVADANGGNRVAVTDPAGGDDFMPA
jgi:hypothetical protein